MDLTGEHISSLQKTQTVSAPTLSSVSYVHTGIFLSYTETNCLNIHCPITNKNIEKMKIPEIKQAVLLFDNMLLYSTKDAVKYFSFHEKQISRSFPSNNPQSIQAKPIDDVFMVVNQDNIEFHDLRYKNPLSRLNVKNTIATINNDSWAIIIDNSVLKIYDHGSISPRVTKKFTNNVSHLKLTNDNKYLILVTNKSILLVETQRGETIHRFFIDNVIELDISEDSQFVFFLLKGKVSIFSIKERKLINNIIFGNEQHFISVNPSYSQFITGGPDFTFFSVDKQTLQQ